MQFGEKFLNQAERKFGNLAFPGLLRWIAGFEFLGLILSVFSPGFAEMVIFDREKILSGEVWRILSWIVVPTMTAENIARGGLLLGIITVLFLFFMSDIIEGTIGTFRSNVYIVATILFTIIAAFLPFAEYGFTMRLHGMFFSSMIFAAAVCQPNFTIMLMFIIPIKLKWLAWIDAAFIVGAIAMGGRLAPINTGLVFVALIPFLFGIFPSVIRDFKNEASAAARRAKFQRETGTGENQAFHTCSKCGITDQKDPDMIFRVSSDDGKEYCENCRESVQSASEAAGDAG